MWYYVSGQEKIGPLTESEISSLIKTGEIIKKTLMWKEDTENWIEAESTIFAKYFVNDLQNKDHTYLSTDTRHKSVKSEKGKKPFIKLWKRVVISSVVFVFLMLTFASKTGVVEFVWRQWTRIVEGESRDLYFHELSTLGQIFIGTFVVSSIILLLVSAVIFIKDGITMHYRLWSVVHDKKTKLKPLAAVVFLFIPIFNMFWFFISFYGLAKRMNQYCIKNEIKAPKISIPLSLSVCCIWIFLHIFDLFARGTAFTPESDPTPPDVNMPIFSYEDIIIFLLTAVFLALFYQLSVTGDKIASWKYSQNHDA